MNEGGNREGASRIGTIPILMYHHVCAPPPADTPSRYLFVTPERFRRQMKALKFLGYRGCSLADLAPYLSGEKHGKVVGITFDDGYRNVHRNALPVLADCGFSATTYFVSRQIGGSNVWDRDYMPYEPCMDLGELREWCASGQEAGGHTLDHLRLTDLSADEASRQIAGCKAELEDMTGCRVDAFSYPFGSHDGGIADIVAEAGYTTATRTQRRRATGRDERMLLPRLTVRLTDTLPAFLWKAAR